MGLARSAWILVALSLPISSSIGACGDDAVVPLGDSSTTTAMDTSGGSDDGVATSTAGEDTAAATSAADSTGDGDEAPEDTLWADRVLNIAHAGGKGTRPEHTMIAYETAMMEGTDVLELDVHATADGVLVLMHDETVDRTTDGTGLIKDKTLAQLQALDAGYTFTTDDGATYPFRGMGLTVPTLDEVFTAFPDVAYVIEIKQDTPSIVEPFLDTCDAHGMLDQMVASAFSQEVLVELRAAAPDVPTSFALPEVLAFLALDAAAEKTYVPPGQFLQVPIEQSGFPVLSADFVERAKRFDLQVHAWTINDQAQMQLVIDWGVDGVITDFPARLRDLLAAQ